MLIGGTDAEAETPILWPSDAKNQLTGKGPDVRRDLGQEKNGLTEDEIVGQHHRLDGNEFDQSLGDGKGQEACNAAVHGVAKSQT